MDKLYQKIESLINEKEAVILSIEGGAGSGKTTLAAKLQKKFGGNVYHMDDFFLPPDMRTKERLDTPGGNVHYERFCDEVVDGIYSDDWFTYGVFDCSVGKINRFREMPPTNLHIVEGVYSAHPFFEEIYDLRIFLEIDVETQRERIRKRNGDMAEMFFSRWIPLENKYFEAYNTKEKSDIILNGL